jgi:hypothetical protein
MPCGKHSVKRSVIYNDHMKTIQYMLCEALRRIDGIMDHVVMLSSDVGDTNSPIVFGFGNDDATMSLTTDCETYVRVVIYDILYEAKSPGRDIHLGRRVPKGSRPPDSGLYFGFGAQDTHVPTALTVLRNKQTRVLSVNRFESDRKMIPSHWVRIYWGLDDDENNQHSTIDILFTPVPSESLQGRDLITVKIPLTETRIFKYEAPVFVKKDSDRHQVFVDYKGHTYKIDGRCVDRFSNVHVSTQNETTWYSTDMFNLHDKLLLLFDPHLKISSITVLDGGGLDITWEYNIIEGRPVRYEKLKITFVGCNGSEDSVEQDVDESDVCNFLKRVCESLVEKGPVAGETDHPYRISAEKTTHSTWIRVLPALAVEKTYIISQRGRPVAMVYLSETDFQLTSMHRIVDCTEYCIPLSRIQVGGKTGYPQKKYKKAKLQTAIGIRSITQEIQHNLNSYFAHSIYHNDDWSGVGPRRTKIIKFEQ